MKIATFSLAGERRVGQVDEVNQIIVPFDLPMAQAEKGILALIDQTDTTLPAMLTPMPLTEVQFDAPIPRPPRNIFCVGKNYYDHAHEFSNSGFDSSAAASAVPSAPIIFSKVPESVIAHRANVIIDSAVSLAVDYEVELAVIIGKTGHAIKSRDAFDYVWGYTIINDVTARDLQGKYSQWLVGKSQDTFCPMGPWAVTRGHVDISSAGIRCWVNDELRQESKLSLLIFDIPTIIETISAGVTLYPGDIIATGTPAGVGIGFKPPKYLKPGDIVRMEIDGIGTLENQFVEKPVCRKLCGN